MDGSRGGRCLPAYEGQSAMKRITIRRMMIGIALIAGLLSIVVPFTRYIGHLQYRSMLGRQADSMILGLSGRCPTGINPTDWAESVNWTQIIGMNLYAGDHIGLTEKERLNEDMAQRLSGGSGSDIIPWIWCRYERMAKGTSSENYVRFYRRLALRPWDRPGSQPSSP
jgi:hypothetical protein